MELNIEQVVSLYIYLSSFSALSFIVLIFEYVLILGDLPFIFFLIMQLFYIAIYYFGMSLAHEVKIEVINWHKIVNIVDTSEVIK